jgi:hypothetical protein
VPNLNQVVSQRQGFDLVSKFRSQRLEVEIYRQRKKSKLMLSDQALYCWLTNLSFHLDIPKFDNGLFHKIKWMLDKNGY